MTDIISRVMLWSTWSQTYENMVGQAVAEWMRNGGDHHDD